MAASTRKNERMIRQMLAEGYDITCNGKGHYQVIDREGNWVRYPNGRPVVLSFSPRTEQQQVVRSCLKRAGVLRG